MKKPYAVLMLLVLAICSTAACKKENSFESFKTELLTAGSWKIDKAILKTSPLSSDATTVDTLFMQDCQADDRITFRPDGTQFFSNGPVSCDSSEVPSTITSWEWLNGETILQQTDPIIKDRHNYSVKVLAKNAMVLEFKEVYQDSLTVNLTIYYSH